MDLRVRAGGSLGVGEDMLLASKGGHKGKRKKKGGTAFLSKTSDIGTYWKRLRPPVCLNRLNVCRLMDGSKV